jgi:hypothetical protein
MRHGTEWRAQAHYSDPGQLTVESEVNQWILRKSASTCHILRSIFCLADLLTQSHARYDLSQKQAQLLSRLTI